MRAPSCWRFTMPSEMAVGPPFNLDRLWAQLFAGLGALAMLVLGIGTTVRGGSAGLLFLWMWAVTAPVVAVPVWSRWSRPSRADDLETRDATTVAPYYASTIPLTAAFFVALVAGLLALLVAALVEGWSSWTLLLLLPLAIFLAHLTNIAVGRVARGSLALTPAGVTHHGWSFSTFIPWDAVNPNIPMIGGEFFVAAARGDDVVSVERTTWWRFDSPRQVGGTPALWIDGNRFRFEAELLHMLVSHYATNPLDRRTLGTADAIERARFWEERAASTGQGR